MRDLKQKLSSFLKTSKIGHKRDYFPILILIVSVVFFYPVLFQGKDALPTDALVGAHVPWNQIKWEGYPAGVPIKNQEITDAISQFYPWRSLVGEYWREGKAPLWNPYMFFGTPFLATLHSASLYPLNFLYVFFSNITSWNLLVFLQIFLSAIFMYVFLKSLKLSGLASFFGSFGFALSGYMIAWLEFATGGHTGLWLPAILFFQLKLFETKRKIWAIPIAFSFFMIFTAGDFQVPIYISAFYLLFGVWKAIDVNEKFLSRLKAYTPAFLAFLSGVVLSLPQLLPTFELFTNSIRSDDPYISEYLFGIMHWKKVTNFIWPDFFGNVVTRNYWAEFGYHEYLSYAGIIGLVLVFYSLFTKKTRTEKFIVIALTTSLLFLFPTPVSFLPYKLRVPGLSTSSASRIIFLVDFCLATLSAYGLSKWIKARDRRLEKIVLYLIVLSSAVFLAIGCSLWIFKGYTGSFLEVERNLRVAMRNMVPGTMLLVALFMVLLSLRFATGLFKKRKKVLVNLAVFAIILLSLVDMLRFAWKNTPFSPREFLFPETETIEYMQKDTDNFRILGPGIPLNYFMAFELASSEGYDPIYPLRNGEWFSAVNFGHIQHPSRRYGQVHNLDSPLVQHSNIKYVVDYKKNIAGEVSERGEFLDGLEEPFFEKIFSEGLVSIYRNNNYMPKVWFANDYIVEPDRQKVVEMLSEKNIIKDRIIVLEEDLKLEIGDNLANSISDINHRLNGLSFNVNAKNAGVLHISESYYPGWSAYVDGKETQLYVANHLFMALPVDPGIHKVELNFSPPVFRKSLYVATVGLVLLIVYVFVTPPTDKSGYTKR